MNLKRYPDFVRFEFPAFVWMVLIFILSSLPGSTYAPYSFPYAHLIAHTLLFGTLYYLGYRALRYQRLSKLLSEFSLIFSLIFVVLYGASDEYHQSFVPGRTEELKDLLVDVSSAVLVLIILLITEKIKSARFKLKTDESK